MLSKTALLSLFTITHGLALPYSDTSDASSTTWMPLTIPAINGLGNGFSRMKIRDSIFQDDFDVGNQNLTSWLSKRVEETAPPPGTQFIGLEGSQWDSWHMDVVIKAWGNALEMAQLAATSLDAIKIGSPAYDAFLLTDAVKNCPRLKSNPDTLSAAGRKEFNRCYRQLIAGYHLAYGQYFGADPEYINRIAIRYQTIVDMTNNIAAPNRNKRILYVSWGPSMTNTAGKNECGKEKGVYPEAMVIPVEFVKDLPGTIYPQDAQLLHLCPPFFESTMGRIELQLSALAKATNLADRAKICRLDKLDSTARILLHELTHLPWTLDTNFNNDPEDERGWLNVVNLGTTVSAAGQKAQRTKTKEFSFENADSYAWMAIYNYFNSLDLCKGVRYTGVNQAPGTCNADVWPQGTDKPVRTSWESYISSS